MADSNPTIKLSLIDDISKQLNNISSSVNNTTKNVGSFAKSAVAGFAKVGAVLTATGGTLTGFAVKNASNLQMLSTSFETLTGDVEKGRKAYEDLVKMGAKTPFNTQDLAKATQTMLSFGMSLEDSQKMLNVLGDVSMGNREKLGSLSLAFSQVQSTGRLMGQDLLQMINQGFNPLQIISQKTGKSMAVLKKEMEDGAISADMVTDAFISSTSEGGLFYQGMDKGSKTLSGTFSTLMDNITLMGTGLVGLAEDGTIVKGSLLDLVQNGVNILNERLGAIDWIKVGSMIQNNVVIPINTLREAFVLATQRLSAFWSENQGRILPVLEALKNALIFIGSNVMVMFQYAWERLREPVMQLWSAISQFVTAITPILQTLAFIIIPLINVAFAIMVNQVVGAINMLSGVLRMMAGLFNVIFGTIRGILTGDFSQAVNGFKQIGNGMVDFVRGLVDRVLAPFRGIRDGIYNIFRSIDLYRAGQEMINGLINGVKSNIGGLANTIKSGLKKIPGFDKIPGFATGVRNFGGGLAMVGENGPELVNLPRGASVMTNNQSQKIGTEGVTININNPTVREDNDITLIVESVKRALSQDLKTKMMGL